MKPLLSRKDLLTAMIESGKAVSKVEVQQVTMGPGMQAPLHLHPCPAVGVVMEGAISFQVEGRSAKVLGPGDAFYEPADTPIARFDNDGDSPAKFVVFYLLGQNERETVRILI